MPTYLRYGHPRGHWCWVAGRMAPVCCWFEPLLEKLDCASQTYFQVMFAQPVRHVQL